MALTAPKLRVGINGCGRIGRAITRINLEKDAFDLVAINDVNPDIENVAYLLKYDSTYGRLRHSVAVADHHLLFDGIKKTAVYSEKSVALVPWQEHGVDVVIDASGNDLNLFALPELDRTSLRHCIVTNSPDQIYLDKSVIVGVNEQTLTPSDFVVSASICDATAFVSVIHLLDRAFGIEYGSLTTLHPWLSYQRLLDGQADGIYDPPEYGLGRASTTSLIPKPTTAVRAAAKIIPGIDDKFISMSYRVPTMIVSAADIVVKLARQVTKAEVVELFRDAELRQRYPIIQNNFEPLVSADFTGSEYSAIVDQRWTEVQGTGQLKLVLWYDNEWGYSSRVVDLVTHLASLYD
ncbi:MAG: aldehyde dehydrogenase [Chloroflexi bacterium]|nr:aldehyde dehydrogenase [Chloroflexota bacterium]